MGRRKKLQNDSRVLSDSTVTTFTDVFNKAFPDYLVMGMSYEQYWYGEPALALMYWRANRLHIERKNQEMYMQGMYNFQAFSRALANLNFSGKHKKPVDYLEEPYQVLATTVEEHEAEVEKAKAKVKAKLNAWKREFDSIQ